MCNIFDSLKNRRDADTGLKTDIKAVLGRSRFADNPLYLTFSNLGAYNLQLFLLFISLLLKAGDIFLFFFLLYYLSRFLVQFAYYFQVAYKELND